MFKFKQTTQCLWRYTTKLELPPQFREIPWNQTTDVHQGSTLR